MKPGVGARGLGKVEVDTSISFNGLPVKDIVKGKNTSAIDKRDWLAGKIDRWRTPIRIFNQLICGSWHRVSQGHDAGGHRH